MKKLLLSLLLLVIGTTLFADMRFDPISGRFFSHPQTSDINQQEYDNLFSQCAKIYNNMLIASAPYTPSFKDVVDHCSLYLKRINTPTALRLITDINKNTVHYTNGSYLFKVF